jgi:hypothetical protein
MEVRDACSSLSPGEKMESIALHHATLGVGDRLEVEWPCQQTGTDDVRKLWFPVIVQAVRQGKRCPHYTLLFEDGGEAEHSLREIRCREISCHSAGDVKASKTNVREPLPEEVDTTGFVMNLNCQQSFWNSAIGFMNTEKCMETRHAATLLMERI